VKEFEDIANARYNEADLQDGYAPFCKHIFIQNDFTNAKVNVLKISPDNESLLRSTYDARNDKELPVLQRWFPKELVQEDSLPVAKYLDLILYSREQIIKVHYGNACIVNIDFMGCLGRRYPKIFCRIVLTILLSIFCIILGK